MRPETIAALDRLMQAEWFTKTGVRDATTAHFLRSWVQAQKAWRSIEWTSVFMDADDQNTVKAFRGSIQAEEIWKRNFWAFINELNEKVPPLVRQKIKGVMGSNNLPEEFEWKVRHSISAICKEVEFADFCRPGFFANLAFWYFRGHFPCGCQGVGDKVPYFDVFKYKAPDMYSHGFFDPISKWYEKGDFGNWQGQIPHGKLIVY